MENVKHHVIRSGNNSLRGFFGSESVDFFGPPSLSLRENIMKAKAKVIDDLASGATLKEDQQDIVDLMTHSENSDELIRMVGAIGGWKGLDSELDQGQVDYVARQLAQVLDQRDYVVYQLIRRYLILLDYNASPNLGDCFAKLLLWPKEFQQKQFDYILACKEELLKGIASATMRGRTNMEDAARIHVDVIEQYLKVMPYRKNILALMYEVNYTTRICSLLQRLDYKGLYHVIADMVNHKLTDLQRSVCKDRCIELRLEFAAAAQVVELVGSNEAKSTVNRFMRTRKAAIDNFPTTLPAPTAVGAIAAALGEVGTTWDDLISMITKLPDVFIKIIDALKIFDTASDDNAGSLISELHSQGTLAHVAFTVKCELIKELLNGWTVDDDENAINQVMQAAKDYDKAELYQLAAAATWESLNYCVDGDQNNELVSMLHDLFLEFLD